MIDQHNSPLFLPCGGHGAGTGWVAGRVVRMEWKRILSASILFCSFVRVTFQNFPHSLIYSFIPQIFNGPLRRAGHCAVERRGRRCRGWGISLSPWPSGLLFPSPRAATITRLSNVPPERFYSTCRFMGSTMILCTHRVMAHVLWSFKLKASVLVGNSHHGSKLPPTVSDRDCSRMFLRMEHP